MITFDNLILEAFISQEIEFITGARINKIQQPTRRELILTLRNKGISRKLYINILPQLYHICFMNDKTEKLRDIEIPKQPPMFCMLLRKYLENSKISKVSLPQGERIVELYIETYNELGDSIYLCLAIELMGKHSNIILYNKDTDIIIGCAHNVGADKSTIREVYGQIPYTYPPQNVQNKYIDEKYAFLKSFKNDIFKESDVNNIIDSYYAYLIQKNKFQSLKSEYKTIISKKLKKNNQSLNDIQKQVEKNNNSDRFRLYGDLLMANLYNLKDYTKIANLYNYENKEQINIPLDENKTIKENANKYYNKYSKAKRSNIVLNEQIEKYNEQKLYFESLIYAIDSSQQLSEIKELEEEVKNKGTIKNYNKNSITPLQITLDSNTNIYIGKNNKQNDYIVSKLADEDDLWFHTKDCPGSHVLLKTQKVTDELILKCAQLAKHYSSGSKSSKIGVIYTKRKYLRKPPKANLGYVTYKNEKEIVID